MKVRERRPVLDAVQWRGSHPLVKQYSSSAEGDCRLCLTPLREHGYVASNSRIDDVCPDGWLVNHGHTIYVVTNKRFEERYECVSDQSP